MPDINKKRKCSEILLPYIRNVGPYLINQLGLILPGNVTSPTLQHSLGDLNSHWLHFPPCAVPWGSSLELSDLMRIDLMRINPVVAGITFLKSFKWEIWEIIEKDLLSSKPFHNTYQGICDQFMHYLLWEGFYPGKKFACCWYTVKAQVWPIAAARLIHHL